MENHEVLAASQSDRMPICIYGVIIISRDIARRYCITCYQGLTPTEKEGLGLMECHFGANAETANLVMRCQQCQREILMIQRMDECGCWEQCTEYFGEIEAGALLIVKDQDEEENLWYHVNPEAMQELADIAQALSEYTEESDTPQHG